MSKEKIRNNSKINQQPKNNNFIPSSNLSQFLLKKGSSGSLRTFENNEYNYKINLDSINTGGA